MDQSQGPPLIEEAGNERKPPSLREARNLRGPLVVQGHMKPFLAVVLLALVLVSCGTEPRTGAAGPSVASGDVLEVACYGDGSTAVEQRSVTAQRDGVHIRVDNRAGEFVSLNGTGMDFSKGVSEQAPLVPPGKVEIACWPGSMHEGPEPKRTAVTVLDPNSYWVPADLECPGDKLIAHSTLDYASNSSGERGKPEEIAMRTMEGVEANDRIFTAGYPEAAHRDVAVERDGEVVALLGYSPTENGGWILGSYSACPSSGVNY